MRSKPHGHFRGVDNGHWSNGLKNVRAVRYYVTQLLARTVGSSAEKIIYTVAPSHYANVVSTTELALSCCKVLHRCRLLTVFSRLRFHTS